jgi:GTPase SAR1 family protein
MDLCEEGGFCNDDNVKSNTELVAEIQKYSQAPIVLFANKTDLLWTRVWVKIKDIYLEDCCKTSSLERVSHSRFAEFPREITLNILYYVVSLYDGWSTTTASLDHTRAYKELAEKLNLQLFFGSALRNEGVNEVVQAALLLALTQISDSED